MVSYACRVAFAAMVLSGCSGSPDQEVSADEQSITVQGDLRAPSPFRVDAVPAVVLEAPEDSPFFWIKGVVRLENGHIVVANSGTHQLQFFDERGNHIRSVGAEGDGPGEFRDLDSVVRTPRDSLLVWDRDRRRASLFTPSGDFVRTIHLPVPPSPFVTRRYVTGVLSDGSIVERGWILDDGAVEVTRQAINLFSADGEHLRQVGIEENFPCISTAASPCDFPIFGVRAVVRMIGDEILFSTRRGPVIEVIDPATGERESFQWPQELLPIQARDQVPFHEAAAAIGFEPHFASHMPAMGDVHVDARGLIWIEEVKEVRPLMSYLPGLEVVPSRDPTWRVLRRSGEWVGVVHMPPSVQSVAEIGFDYLISINKDPLGVESVSVHRVAEGGEG